MIRIAILSFIFTLGSTSLSVQAKEEAQVIPVAVTTQGFEPSTIHVKAGTDLTLEVTRKTDVTCAKEIVFKKQKIKRELPLNQTVSIHVGKLKDGEVKFACGMDMISGRIVAK